MSKLDRIILSIVIIFLLISVFFYPFIFIKILGIIIFCLYFLFGTFHIVLCVPLIAVVILFHENFNRITILKQLKSLSVIIWFILYIILLISYLIIIYFGTPLIAAMLYNTSFNISDAIILLQNL